MTAWNLSINLIFYKKGQNTNEMQVRLMNSLQGASSNFCPYLIVKNRDSTEAVAKEPGRTYLE
jgi:hypothetical protein